MNDRPDLRALVVGASVCVSGWGTANPVHSHRYKVTRLTQTMIVTSNGKSERRFRYNGQGVPRGDYGGVSVAIACQRRTPNG